MLCAVHQAAYLLRRQIERQARDFLARGGFTERLHATRVQARAAGGRAVALYGVGQSFNLALTLLVAWLALSGVLLPAPPALTGP